VVRCVNYKHGYSIYTGYNKLSFAEMKLTFESKLLLGILLITSTVIALAVIIMSRPAKPLAREDLVTTNTHAKGNPEAAVWLVEFSDFQCPACGAFESAVEELIKNYPDTLLFAYRHYPLPSHPMAEPAARAAEAAALQGKYWEMHSFLFANQSDLSEAEFIRLAQSLTLDLSKLEKDMKSPEVKNTIEQDVVYGDKIGISATPTFYLNGVKISPSTPEKLKKMVEDEILNK